jgi:protein SPT2
MKQASEVKSDKLKVSVKVKESKKREVGLQKASTTEEVKRVEKSAKNQKSVIASKGIDRSANLPAGPAPTAKPMASLAAKQRRLQELRKCQMDHDDMDDFVVSDEEEEIAHRGYDRDEIWNLFSRGRKRHEFYDDGDDLSDMEASSAQVLAEERRSLMQARKEDELEERRLQKLAEEKRRKKKGHD